MKMKDIIIIFMISISLMFVLLFITYFFVYKENIQNTNLTRNEILKAQRTEIIPNSLESLDTSEYDIAIKKWGNKRIITLYTKDGDIDGDGISDKQEFLFGTNPFNYDTDDDGKMDSAEFVNGSDPLVKD